ncbi:alpha/beta fold hydrolase [Flaviaesturariibacter terrae]
MTLYFLSGLGADERVFSRLVLPPAYRVVHLPWIANEPDETLPRYALRMAERIDRSEPYGLVGLSFGGMLATEIAKTFEPWRTVLISSAATRRELPALFRAAGRIGLARLAPLALFKVQHAALDWLFGAGDPDTRELLHALINDCDARFNKWALAALLSWHNSTVPPSVRRIHGTADRVLPPRRLEDAYWIRGGGHLAVFTQAAAVSAALVQCLEEDH